MCQEPCWWSRFAQSHCIAFRSNGKCEQFLPVSNALANIGCHGLDIVWSAFFDDDTVVCCEQEDVNVTFYVESLFRLLGIEVTMPFINTILLVC